MSAFEIAASIVAMIIYAGLFVLILKFLDTWR